MLKCLKKSHFCVNIYWAPCSYRLCGAGQPPAVLTQAAAGTTALVLTAAFFVSSPGAVPGGFGSLEPDRSGRGGPVETLA